MNHTASRQYRSTAPRKYRFHHQMMTRQEATAIRAAHVQGKPVLALELQEAYRVLSKKAEPRKLRLPELSRPEKERVNAILLFRLGLALGRIQGQAA